MISQKDAILLMREKPKVWKGETFVYAEQKLDGIRLTVLVDDKGDIFCAGRKHYINLWPKIQRHELLEARIRKLPPGTVLDGELHTRDRSTSSDVISFIGTGTGLMFTPFSIPWYSHVNRDDQSYQFHRNLIEDLDFIPPKEVFLGRDGATDYVKDTKSLADYCRHEMIEGLVLKAGPCSGWWKLKPVKAVDAIVMRWEEGTSRNVGRLGALVVGVWESHPLGIDFKLREIANVGTGFSDYQRDDITEEDSVGRVVEVAYDCVAAQGRLRFPRFVRFRDDKPHEECRGQELED